MTDVIPEAPDTEMLLNTSTDGEVTVGASLSDPVQMDDTREGSQPKVIIVERRRP